ncbi:Glycosyltransferase Gtf1 [compost metagenome]
MAERDFSEDYKRVISVGSMHDDRKGFDKQINIWKKINAKYPDWKLDIYGDGASRKDLQQLIDVNNLTNIVSLKGTTDQVEEEFRKSSFFLFTSKAEGLPMVMLEAMSCGLPCVSYDCPDGPADIIDNNENGYLIDMNDELTMIAKISYLIENKEEIERMGNNAQHSAKSYLPDSIIPKWVEFFNSIKKK